MSHIYMYTHNKMNNNKNTSILKQGSTLGSKPHISPLRYCSSIQKTQVILQKVQVASYS